MTFNIGAQEIVVFLYRGVFNIPISIFFGTAVGILVKYFLDKNYIFKFHTNNAIHDRRTFFLYTIMGLITTPLFWGFEFGFQYFFATRTMRYFGACLGLTIGYITKYQLDKRFVFRGEAP